MKSHIIYTRVSTEEQAREGASLHAQRESCEMMCKFRNLSDVEVIEDAGLSAKDLKRPGIASIVTSIEAGEVKAVVIWRLDRLTRNLHDLLDLVELFNQRDVALISVTEQLDTSTPMGRLTLSMLGAMGQWERESIAERVKLGMRHRQSQGFWVGGVVPACCKLDGPEGQKRIVPDERYAPIARGAWQRIVTGASLGQVATWLNEEMIPASTKKDAKKNKWNRCNLHYWLTNENMIGLLVDNALFLSCKQVLSSRMSPTNQTGTVITGNRTERVWPLKGLTRCGLCGGGMVGSTSYGRSGEPHYYLRCSNRMKGNDCNASDLAAGPWEKAVMDVLAKSAHGNGDLIPQLEKLSREQRAAEGPAKQRKIQLVMERDGMQKRIDTLIEIAIGDTATSADKAIAPKLVELHNHIERLGREIAICDAEIAAAAMAANSADFALDKFRTRATTIDKESVEVQHMILSSILSEVHLAKDKPMRLVFWWPLQEFNTTGSSPNESHFQRVIRRTDRSRSETTTSKKDDHRGSHDGRDWYALRESNPGPTD